MNNGIEIVIIEDNPSDAELLLRVFKRHNVANNIVLLKDGAEALEYFFSEKDESKYQAGSPKIIILDLKLPKVNGIEVLRQIKSHELTKHTPVVVLTSSKEDRDLKESYAFGVNSFVTKPIKFDEFVKVVSELEMYWLLINKPPVTN
jgi:CheY-like chemotaxis protein